MDIQYLKIILEKLAEDHARCIEGNNLKRKKYKAGSSSVTKNNEEQFLNAVQRILDEINDETIDRNVLIDGMKTTEGLYETLLNLNEDYVIVDGYFSPDMLFLQNSGNTLQDLKTVAIRKQQHSPLVYNVLLTIFSFTSQDVRQRHFHELLDHYYNSLKENLYKLSLDTTTYLPITMFQKHINKFLPCVKLEILKQCCQELAKDTDFFNAIKSKESEPYKKTYTSILEMNECILFPNLYREDCYTIIKNKIGSSDYAFFNYRVIPLQEREGYLGDYFKLKIEIEFDDEYKLFHFFAKCLPTYSDLAIEMAAEAFEKEEFYYLKFIPELNDFGLRDTTNYLPKCYFSRTNEVLIFDDLIMENFKTFSVSVSYSYEMLSMTVKQLAKVHASSLLYEELSSRKANQIVRLDEKYPKYVEEKNIRCSGEGLMAKSFDCAIRTFLDMLSVFPEIHKSFSVEEFRKRAERVFDLCFEKVKKSDKYRNVLCQGDCWASNILFKIGKDDLPVDCRLVDFQLTRYCPPGHDIYLLMFMATDKETRKKFESKLLHEYYSEVSNILQRFEVDLKNIYTYEHFLDSCNYMKSQGLCQAAMVLQFVLFPNEKMKDILKDRDLLDKIFYDDRDIFVEELKCKGIYGQRMKELIEDMYEICENIL